MALNEAAVADRFVDALGEVNGEGTLAAEGLVMVTGTLLGMGHIVDAEADDVLTGNGDGGQQLDLVEGQAGDLAVFQRCTLFGSDMVDQLDHGIIGQTQRADGHDRFAVGGQNADLFLVVISEC